MVRCGMGMQQCAMHNATIQKTTFFELSLYWTSEMHVAQNKFETTQM